MKRVLKAGRRTERLARFFGGESAGLSLVNGSRIGVVGGGPAGAFFAYFLLKMAEATGLDISVDIYEPRFFSHPGPGGCNHCGGIVSESLVQLLATEGIDLPPSVVRRGIEAYVLHTDVGDVRIDTPLHEKRIAAVYRGSGPKESGSFGIIGLDEHLLNLSASIGANVVRKLVTGLEWQTGKPQVTTADRTSATYDLLAVAAGVNSRGLDVLHGPSAAFQGPGTMRTFICEFRLGQEFVSHYLGEAMHVFLLDIPRLEFAALIPKGEFVTLCLLGDGVDEALVESFLATPEVKRCFPESVVPKPACHCFPRINVRSAARPFGDRIVWIGDIATSRLYKDGIGSAYRTAKAAARTAVFHGISATDFETHFWPDCRHLIVDNKMARLIFAVTAAIQKLRFLRRGVLRMTACEQTAPGNERRMSSVLWDVFTGSAPYREILQRTFHPLFPLKLGWNLIAGNVLHAARRR